MVDLDVLQSALNITVKRFPSIAARLRKGAFWYYLEESTSPEDLIGKKVCLVTNLKPAKLCGVDSYGMLLASGEDDVKVVFLDPTAKNGDRIH